MTVPAHPWELRADVLPLELAAQRWDEFGALLSCRADELVAVARRATDGWDAAAADRYEAHRRRVLAHLDRFIDLATEIAGALRTVSSVLTSSQKELDRVWVTVALVPHDVVGESRHLVFHPSEDDDRGKVTQAQAQTEEIRHRLALALDQEGARLRSTRAAFATVRSELTILVGGAFTGGLIGEEVSGVGTVAPPSAPVRGAAQSGTAALPPVAAISVPMPDLTGISSAAVTPLSATAASGLGSGLGSGRGTRRTTHAVPPMGGMGGGAMAVRAGTTSRGTVSGRSGLHRLVTPKLSGSGSGSGSGSADDDAARLARDKEAAKQAEKEATRAALAEKRPGRAARRPERESQRRDRDLVGEIESDGETDAAGRSSRR